jgi:hypothetical protein
MKKLKRKSADVPACCTCKFWEFSWRPKDNYAEGECHRYAPRPIPYAVTQMTQLLGAVAWATETAANIEHDEFMDYRADTTEHQELWEWPLTRAAHWCGDYSKRKSLADVKDSHPALKARFKRADQWEKQVGLDGSGPWVGTKFKEHDERKDVP